MSDAAPSKRREAPDRNLALELVRVTEAGAMAAGRWVGRVGPWLPEGAIGTEVGWAISPIAWGKGYATEAAHAAIAWAFDHLGWTDVIHCIDAPNTASIAVAERLGSAWLRADHEADGKEVQVYGQSRNAWRAANPAGR